MSTTPTTFNARGAIGAPKTVTAVTYTVLDSDLYITFNCAASCTVTLPSAADWVGRELAFRTIAAFTVISASSNVYPRTSNTAGTAILPATAGANSRLVSDGTQWVTAMSAAS